MVSRETINQFLVERTLALVGVSRNGKGFGNIVRKELAAKGYRILLVHPEAESIDGQKCARSLAEVAKEVGGVVLVTPPPTTIELVRQAAEAGIRRIWMQRGAESEEAISFCEEQKLAAVHHECLLMFAEPAGGVHRFHRWVRGLFGKLPQ
jgi:uncharacterized protein